MTVKVEPPDPGSNAWALKLPVAARYDFAMSSPDSALDLARLQFGANAQHYVESETHAKGKSLERLVEIAALTGEERVLDIATGAGHVPRVLGPHVAHVVATDITEEMLKTARGVMETAALTNVSFEIADAHNLPFDDATFDLVTCRIAPHHFSNPPRFVYEAARVTRPGGRVIVIDNVAPHDDAAARWIDDFERQRDPSHIRCLPIDEWTEICVAAGLVVTHVELLGKSMNFAAWADNMSVDGPTRMRLLAELTGAPAAVAMWLRPEVPPAVEPDAASFVLTEGIVVAQKPTSAASENDR